MNSVKKVNVSFCGGMKGVLRNYTETTLFLTFTKKTKKKEGPELSLILKLQSINEICNINGTVLTNFFIT